MAALRKTDEGDSEALADELCGIGSALEYCVEKDELFALIAELPSVPQELTAEEASLEKFSFITNKYQEQPHLLDPHLERMLSELMSFGCSPTSSEPLRHLAFKFLYQLTKVRGHKYIIRLMSHEVADLEPALVLLNSQDTTHYETWETRYMLLLWLSIICLIPFDMKLFDGAASDDQRRPVMERILEVAKRYLGVTDKSRDAAGLLIAKFISRPDVRPVHMASTVEWLRLMLTPDGGMTGLSSTLVCGALSTLASLFKHGRREDLLPYGEGTLECLLNSQLLTSNNTLLRKLAVKLVQRIALIMLQARVCAWRYQRGSRSLAMNLGPESATTATTTTGSADQTTKQADVAASIGSGGGGEEDFDVPEVVESILETIWQALSDKDTIVRWSAAKGVGRITARLPKGLGDEVVAYLLSLFSPLSSHTAWHGGCLALAELGRRGLLPPSRLVEVVPVVVKATAYDQLWGSCSIGSHVRDAACYACWSFARAYEPNDIAPYVDDIATALIITTVWDREINCRRAASAAFQEHVGRQGMFPHGIGIVTMADYYAVGNRANAYLKLSVQLASFPKYCVPLIDACLTTKISHWDQFVRDLGSRALHNLTAINAEYIAEEVFPVVVGWATSCAITECHGGMLATGEICHALAKLCTTHASKTSLKDWITDAVMERINDIISTLKAMDTFKGVHSMEARVAGCRLVENLSRAQFPIRDTTVRDSWQWLIDDCLPYVDNWNTDVTDAALAAQTPFMSHYYATGNVQQETRDAVVDFYCRELRSNLVFPRRGYALGLGGLPPVMLHGKITQILSALIAATKVESVGESQFAEARRDAVKALGRFCLTAGFHNDADPMYHLPTSTAVPMLYDACLVALQDYTMDSRGDIGASVREASMVCLQDLTMLLAAEHPSCLTEALMVPVMGALLQQSSEKIDRTRAVAGRVITKLLHSTDPLIAGIAERQSLSVILPEDLCSTLNWACASDAFPHTVKLLSVAPYRRVVLTGLIVSVGGMTESLVKHSSNALVEFLQSFTEKEENLALICDDVLAIFKMFKKVDRVIIPLLKTLDTLLSVGCFEAVTTQEGNTFPTDLLASCKAEVARCTDAKKLIDSIPVFCGLLQFPELRTPCLQQLTIFLGHKYPRVRCLTADYLLVAMVSYADTMATTEMADDSAMEDTDPMILLSSTSWDNDTLTNVRVVRNQICRALNVPEPKAVSNAQTSSSAAAAKPKENFTSYQDLVARAGY